MAVYDNWIGTSRDNYSMDPRRRRLDIAARKRQIREVKIEVVENNANNQA